jgi:hypothetical protein
MADITPMERERIEYMARNNHVHTELSARTDIDRRRRSGIT